jgi:hypothetical protein
MGAGGGDGLAGHSSQLIDRFGSLAQQANDFETLRTRERLPESGEQREHSVLFFDGLRVHDFPPMAAALQLRRPERGPVDSADGRLNLRGRKPDMGALSVKTFKKSNDYLNVSEN